MSRIKVLGVGSPFGNDRIGWEVIQQIQKNKKLKTFIPTLIQIESCDRPGIHLLNRFEDVERVYLIDAIKMNAEPGNIYRFQDDEINIISHNTISSHNLGIAEALSLGRVLDLLPSSIIFYGIVIGDIDYSIETSKIIKKAVLKLTDKLFYELEDQIRKFTLQKKNRNHKSFLHWGYE